VYHIADVDTHISTIEPNRHSIVIKHIRMIEVDAEKYILIIITKKSLPRYFFLRLRN
jgi:hypothetical protein